VASGRTYPVSATPADLLAGLTTATRGAGLFEAEPLLSNALSSVEDGRAPAACGQLTAFVNLVEARTGLVVTSPEAAALIDAATAVARALGCR
jgi:hypothetical protein